MDERTRKRVERVFYDAIERDRADWPAFLDAACGGDGELRREVEALLEHHTRTGDLFDAPRELVESMLGASADAGVEGRSLGPYRLVREIGSGGMGRVFLAEREDLPKRVALKLMREPLASPDRMRRFGLEQRVLAGLEHPHIAQLLDAGVTEDGSPFFAMEYVDGEPITVYCDRTRQTVEGRLRLFLSVCSAVRYAHANLIVHRDIKPSNILVTSDGRPKLLDFGVAKLLGDDGEAELTGTGTRLFTPNYAAPEQLLGERATTATDIYQLGALLYELLTGRPPLDVAGKDLLATERIVREQEPAWPSAVVTKEVPATTPERAGDQPSRAAPPPTRIAAARSTTPERLRRRLKGDIDTIVLRALEKEPSRRYTSVDALAGDIERFLEGLPVLARPATPAYRLRKLVLRHKAAAAIAALVIGYALTATLGALGIARERDRAEREAAVALRQATKAEQVTAFLLGLFEGSDPSVARGDTITARELLARGVERAGAFAYQPEVQAMLLGVTGRIHFNLGNLDEAEILLRRALRVQERVPDPDLRAIAEVKLTLAAAYDIQSRFDESSAIYRELSETAASGDAGDAEDAEDAGDVDAIRSSALYGLFTSLHALGRQQAADSAFRLWEAAVEDAPPRPDPRIARELVRLGQMLHYGGEAGRAETVLRRAVSYHRALQGELHPDLGNALNALAAALVDASPQRAPAADSATRESVALHRRVFPDGHPQLSLALSLRARFLGSIGRLAEAEALLREALAFETPAPGRDGMGYNARNDALARVLLARGAFAEAEPRLRQAREWWVRNFGPDYVFALRVSIDLAAALTGQGEYAEAERLLLPAHERLRSGRGSDDEYTRYAEARLVELYVAWGRPAEAERYRRLSDARPPGD